MVTKLIAIEEHFLTPAIRAAWTASAIGQEGTAVLDRGEIEALLDDMGQRRLALMDESGVDVQVLSVTTPGLHNLDPELSVRPARQTNDLLAATIAQHPTRLQGFATLPTASPAHVAAELARSVTQLGFKGAMLCGRTRAKTSTIPIFGLCLKRPPRWACPYLSILKSRSRPCAMSTTLALMTE